MSTLSILRGDHERIAPATIRAKEAYQALTGHHGAKPNERAWVVLRNNDGEVVHTAPLGRYVSVALVRAIFEGEQTCL